MLVRGNSKQMQMKAQGYAHCSHFRECVFGCVSAREICQVEVKSHSSNWKWSLTAGWCCSLLSKCASVVPTQSAERYGLVAGTAGNGNGEEESQLLVMGRAWPTQYVAASALAPTNPEWSIVFLLLGDQTSARVLLHCQIRWNTKHKWILTIRTGYQFELVSVASHCDNLVEAK